MSPIEPIAGGVRLSIHVQPRAARTELAGLHGGAIKLRIAAPPVDGAANDEVVRFLADRLGLSRRAVAIVAGPGSRRKIIEALGPTVEVARKALAVD